MLPQNAGHPDPASNPVPSRRSSSLPPGPVVGRIGAPPNSPSRPGPSAAPPGLASMPDASSLFRAMKRRWLLVFGLAISAATVIGGAAWVALEPKHTAFSMVQVAASSHHIIREQQIDGRYEFNVYLKNQVSQLTSRFVLTSALNREDVKKLNLDKRFPDAVAWLEKELMVESKADAEFVRISLAHSDPEEARIIVNGVVQAYKKEVVEKEDAGKSTAVADLDRIYTEARGKLATKRDSQKGLSETLRTLDSETIRRNYESLQMSLGDAKRQSSLLAGQINQAKARLESFKAQEAIVAAAEIPPAVLNQAIDSDPAIKMDMANVRRLKDFIKSLEDTLLYPQRDPRWAMARNKIEETEKSIDTRRAEVKKELEAKTQGQVSAENKARKAILEADLAFMLQQQEPAKATVAALEKEVEKFGKATAEYDNLKSEIAREEKILSDIGNRLEVARYEVNAKPRVTIYQEAALLPQERKKQVLGAGLGGFASLFAAGFLVGLWEFRRRRVHTADELSSGLGIRVVGSVPASADVEMLINAGPDDQIDDHLILASVDAIRTTLLRAGADARILMVTSAEAGEGKTTVASHLAGSLARAGRKTLLVDGDLRQPAVHQLFEVAPQPGFSEVLLGEVDTVDAIQQTNVDGLMVLPAGQWDREVVQSLARGGVQGVLEKLKEEFDFIVVDSHPVLSATDSLLIGQSVDAVLLSVLSDVSHMPRVYATAQRLSDLGIRVLGAVVSGIDPEEVFASSNSCATAAA